MHVWVHGRTGTGKTATVKLALAKHHSAHNVRYVYVNCFRARTAYAILEHLLGEMRVLRAETPHTGYKARRLIEALAGKPLIVALDEIDRMPEDERESILRLLTDASGIGLVCVSEDRDTLTSLGAGTANRITPVIVEMQPYSKDLLSGILEDRSEAGLCHGSWNHGLLGKIAGLSAGDARVAIQTLRSAAHLADCECTGFVEERHVLEGFEKAQHIRREYRLRKLTIHHRIIYDVVKERGKASMNEVLKEYCRRCIQQGLAPACNRSFYRYTETLRQTRLLRGVKARAFGSHTNLEVVE
jgi:archaeal cell division control protein 6